MDGRIFYLKNTLLENIQRNWTISDLAKEIDVSAPYLQRLFKMEIGMPPISYLRDMRLEKSRELLENTFKRINTIGFEVGICCESHFTRDFKKKYNLTPSEYRKRYWEELQAKESAGKIS